jgi:NADPH:quinone reductase-like Zn-dependent oxidoreductase
MHLNPKRTMPVENLIPAQMRAAVYRAYGPPENVAIESKAVPRPKKGQLLVRVHAAALTQADRRARALDMPAGLGLVGHLVFGVGSPRNPILGMNFSGTIVALGHGVEQFGIGDEIFGSTEMAMGCHADYVAVRPRDAVACKPAVLTFAQAAAIPFGFSTARIFLEKAALQSGDTLLVNGASGSVGSALVQLAKAQGLRVTGVASGENTDFVRSLGAADVIDYRLQDFTTLGRRWHAVADLVGNAPIARADAALKPGGKLLLVVADLKAMLADPLSARFKNKKVIQTVTVPSSGMLASVGQQIAAGKLVSPVAKVFPLEDIVAAHRYMDEAAKRGTVVISMV